MNIELNKWVYSALEIDDQKYIVIIIIIIISYLTIKYQLQCVW